ncbi:MAG TPA: choice-of-anchor Q domain-containing protein, partial [Verrucomicrobiae bacterium]
LNNCNLSGNSAGNGGGGASGATLNNCILSGNWGYVGGGASGGMLNNCTLTDNSGGYAGGGANGATLNNCTLSGNSCVEGGGGVSGGTLNNCTLTGNSASIGGGANGGTLNNCIVYYNSAPNGPNYYGSTFNYSCTAPMPTNGAGNIAAAPWFVVTNGWGNLRLRSNSPCINAGNNAYLTNSYFINSLDLGGQPRVVSGTVDIGAYEFQGSGSLISYAWLQQYGLPIDGSADFADPDRDGMSNYQEWLAGTSPLDPTSGLRMLSVAPATNGWTVTWQSAAGIAYVLERSTNLGVAAGFSVIQDNITGRPGTTAYTDTNAVGLGSLFYRVGVR